jgi:hypothetical protein
MGKKTRQNAIRVTSELFELGRMMMSSRGAQNFSEYVRGLILLDAAQYSPELLAGHDLPGWITRDKRFERYFLTREGNAEEDAPLSSEK